ncbi:GNAT family N-acetyltransferase [Streptomyces kunmingensis]|uniref:GNAT family N-acetyltransferase n=1 Tax=Streptomyces kunmingensis TaxID=68225 RepID=A0ABU6CLT2_9ACTN|nr:GNAT family N-acetyltransferase [Streptomyces kunmingensis]MEB3965694.1 GNAT family N-acetyltransferase [Streptomyces kunmingensis]
MRGTSFRRATAEQTDDVLGVLDEAAGWLRARGIDQWPDRFEAEWVADAVTRGETWLVTVEGRIAGTVTLDRSDALWADTAGAAAYVHRMAVRRRVPGLGAVILDWAARTARADGATALRLDCVRSNGRLRTYYEERGFVHRGDVTVGGAPGQREGDGPVTWVSRYERILVP